MIDAFTIPQVYASQTMHDNPKAAPAHEFRLQTHTVLAICGRDAIAFAQAQFMNDVAALPVGHWHWNGWLTPKGRAIALFALLKLDAETLWLLLPDADPAELAAQLQRYVFRSKLKLAPLDLQVIGSFSPPALARGAALGVSADGDIELDMSGDEGPRRLQIRQAPAADDAAARARWNAFDLAHGLPRLPASQTSQWTPQQLSLERLRAFSVSKGCYPGQEIVARTQYLGKVKRHLYRFEALGPVAPGMPVGTADSAEHNCGTVANAAPSPNGGLEGLAVLLEGTIAGAGLTVTLADGQRIALQNVTLVGE